MAGIDTVNMASLPLGLRTQLAELDSELAEGYITDKGYNKRKALLLQKYCNVECRDAKNATDKQNLQNNRISAPLPVPLSYASDGRSISMSPDLTFETVTEVNADEVSESNKRNCENRRNNKRYTRHNSRYLSDVREEFVREVLFNFSRNEPLVHALLPHRRPSNVAASGKIQRTSSNLNYHDISEDSDAKSGSSDNEEFVSKAFSPLKGSGDSVAKFGCEEGTDRSKTESFRCPNIPPHTKVRRARAKRDAYDDVYNEPPPDVLEHVRNINISNCRRACSGTGTGTDGDDSCDGIVNGAASDKLDSLNANNTATSSSSDRLQDSRSMSPSFQPLQALDVIQTGVREIDQVSVQDQDLYMNIANLNKIKLENDRINACLSAVYSSSDNSLRTTPSLPSCDGSSNGLNRVQSRSQPHPVQPQQSSNKVSERIQQLLNTLKRPKTRPLSDYFVDEDDSFISTPQPDPNTAPKPTGDYLRPVYSNYLHVPSCLPKDFIASLTHYAQISPKAPCISCLDLNRKNLIHISYGKLLLRATRIAYLLLNKLGHRGESSLKPNERVALIFPNNDPINYACAFFGCIIGGLVPLSIEVPMLRRDSSCKNIGFLVTSQSIRVALTSEVFYKALPRVTTASHHHHHYHQLNDIAPLPGWPSNIVWVNVEHHIDGLKLPKDWKGVGTFDETFENVHSQPFYISYSFSCDSSIRGVVVSRGAALAHSRALSTACQYCETDVIVSVLDAKREVGLWHGILTAVLNGIRTIFVPYAIIKVDPFAWIRLVTKFKATVILAKSRDMHWTLMADNENSGRLHTLRLLIVADGFNGWSVTVCDAFLKKFRTRGLRPNAFCPCAISAECLTVSLCRPYRTPLYSVSGGATACARRSRFSLNHAVSEPRPDRGAVTADGDDSVGGSGSGSRDELSIGAGDSSLSMQDQCPTLRIHLDLHHLSFGVVRTKDASASGNSLYIQDCGQLLPGATAVVVKIDGPPILCRTDEIGEILINSPHTGDSYWGLAGKTKSVFQVHPLDSQSRVVCPKQTFVRSGLFGFVSMRDNFSEAVIMICGKLDGLLTVSGRRHNADDLISTVLAVEPQKLVYRGRICVFSIMLLKDERVIIAAEVRPCYKPETIYTWMSRVLHVLDAIHSISVYGIVLLSVNHLPKTPFGGIDVHETKRCFEQGNLGPSHLLLCPHSAITNLPEPKTHRQATASTVLQSSSQANLSACSDNSNEVVGAAATASTTDFDVEQVGASAMMVGQLVQGARLAEVSGNVMRPLSSQSHYIADMLQMRARSTPTERLITIFNQKLLEAASLNCDQLDKRASKIAGLLKEKFKVELGSYVVLCYQPGIELICAVYGCFYCGCIPVPVRPPMPTSPCMNAYPIDVALDMLRRICKSSNATLLLSHQPVLKLLRGKELVKQFPLNGWPTLVDTSEQGYRYCLTTIRHGDQPPHQETAYLDYSVSSSGLLYGSEVTHSAVMKMCNSLKLQCELYSRREVLLSLDPYTGLSFVLWCLSPVFCGHHTLIVTSKDYLMAPSTWINLISKRKLRDVFCSYAAIEEATKQLAPSIISLEAHSINLSNVRSLVVVSQERPRQSSISNFTKVFGTLQLSPNVVSTSFGCAVNMAIAVRGASYPEPATVYLDKIALRNDRVKLLERGSPHSFALTECGALLPGVKVVIANPITKGQCADSQLGEIWVSSEFNVTGFQCVEQPFGTSSVLSLPDATTAAAIGDHGSGDAGGSSSGGTETTGSKLVIDGRHRKSGRTRFSPIYTNLAAHPAVIGQSISIQPLQLSQNSRFNQKLTTGDKETFYARTGYVGFVKRIQYSEMDCHDCLFVVEELDESVILRGMRYYPVDLENTVQRSHSKIVDCAIFTWSKLLVVVLELEADEEHLALDIVTLITSRMLEEHFLVTGVVVILDVGSIPHMESGKKQRLLLRDKFVSDHLEPSYVAYNM